MINRRQLVLGTLAAFASAPVFGQSIEQESMREIDALRPGDFAWHPERQPNGPVSVIVSIPQQMTHVYRNGIRIAVSTCSTGRRGHETPTGVFVVLQKDKNHHSSTYNNAPMPNMNRLTWSGVALHAGNLPGYPASHGCVRLPFEFSEKLFEITELGTPVIIANEPDDPWDLIHPGLVLPAFGESALAGAVLDSGNKSKQWHDSSAHPVASILASSHDKEILLVENGEVIQKAELKVLGNPTIGSNVLVLKGLSSQNASQWTALTHDKTNWDPTQPDDQILTRLSTTRQFTTAMVAAMHPGLILITTDLPLHPDTRSGEDFVIMTVKPPVAPIPHVRPRKFG